MTKEWVTMKGGNADVRFLIKHLPQFLRYAQDDKRVGDGFFSIIVLQ